MTLITKTASISDAPKSIDEANRSVDIEITNEAIDRDREIVDAGSLKTEAFMSNPVVLDSHERRGVSRTILGKITDLRRVGSRHLARVKFAETEAAETAWQLAKTGFLRAASIGFRGGRREPEPGQKGVYRLKDVELIEVSLVATPANPQALIKSAGDQPADSYTAADLTKAFEAGVETGINLSRQALAKQLTRV